MINETVSNVGF